MSVAEQQQRLNKVRTELEKLEMVCPPALHLRPHMCALLLTHAQPIRRDVDEIRSRVETGSYSLYSGGFSRRILLTHLQLIESSQLRSQI